MLRAVVRFSGKGIFVAFVVACITVACSGEDASIGPMAEGDAGAGNRNGSSNGTTGAGAADGAAGLTGTTGSLDGATLDSAAGRDARGESEDDAAATAETFHGQAT